ncbi:MAG: FxDxF family PEP-CTERM protein [Sideroxyarcus sp.]|nr:FxDxF family PEP-CTERM protein [Sideroxyarcus sp.]
MKNNKQSMLARIAGVALSMWLGLAGGTANATVYEFGNLLSGGAGVPVTGSFAKLSATDTGSGVWDFVLTIDNDLFGTFGNGAYIGSMEFDFSSNPTNVTTLFLDSNAGGVTTVDSTNGNHTGGAIAFDFGTSFGQNAHNRLSQNDYVHWSVSGLGSGTLNNMYVHVQGIGTNDESGKYTPVVTPVPEPETYAMLLVGLGLLGFSARRKSNSNAF